MPNYNPPVRGQQFIFYTGLVSQSNSATLQSNPTLASGDVKVSKDGGAEANLGTLPAVTPASSTSVKVTVSASEMDADNVTITFRDAAGAEWADHKVNIQPCGALLSGTVSDAGATSTDFDTTLTGLTNDYLNGGFLVFTDGALQGVGRKINDYTSTSGNFDFTGGTWPTAPANGDPFIVIGRSQ